MYLAHITIDTSDIYRHDRRQISDSVMATMATWLRAALDAGGRRIPLPSAGPDLPYEATAAMQSGALACTIYRMGEPWPLVTFVACGRSRSRHKAWDLLLATAAAGGVAPHPNIGTVAPAPPYCAAVVWPMAQAHADMLAWAANFEQLVAWAWIERRRERQIDPTHG